MEGASSMQCARYFLWIVAGAFVLSGCAGKDDQAMMAKEKTLYERLGGKEAITAVVDDFVKRVAADSQINRFFAATDIPKFKANLVDQICEASGGPCKYKGKDMKSAHKGMGITNAHFDALGNDLVASLNHFKVPEKEKSELLAVLGPMRKDIVER
jgi:hemoglobin